MTQLFTPFRLRDLTVQNRLVVSPMCQYSATDGLANEHHYVHLGRFALGGYGLVMVEATAVVPEGRITHGCLGLWTDAQVAPLARIVDYLHANGAKAGIQIGHAGRKGSSRLPWRGVGTVTPQDMAELGVTPWTTRAPSAIAESDAYAEPAEMTVAEIEALPAAFVAAARRALAAGFDIIEIHAAHGYLINEFLSPIANRRGDAYGGGRENRMRLALAVVERVREVWPAEKPISVRISSVDGHEHGWKIEDSVVLACELKARGVDLIDCSASGFAGSPLKPAPSYLVPLAGRIRQEAGIATMAVGLITTPEAAADAVDSGRADLVAMARQALNDPNFPHHARAALGDGEAWTHWPVQAGYAVKRLQDALMG
ncbi:2,4-dienoyl-CoA reductase-like NADH-dependent reductase (Old Yellow Enzyme family) [Hoeflea marina]|uniref:2,4-dienoyl-CoA reductase-like NADH-dependent reductase (Old Yellow Enzyme family) n=1 Tax=Hoeflea marina TaxID=274592 RepID=A0A317PT02_9HYPH|nr:NADH:flavin oxidoreductase/NADH oxidase [Hoeflea marina]PWW03366.1 2,4-dienoyl-CoA reductase-like NADH-dependent reductase (Old Yellow Enzyme family) [Hoeflea marina]